MKKNPIPLHPAQKDVYIDQLLDVKSPHYNVGGYIKLEGNLDKEKFLETVHSTPAIFDAYKMRFEANSSNPSLYVDEDYEILGLTELDFSKEENPHEAGLDWMQQSFNTPFDLEKDHLLFVHVLIKVADREHWFFGKYHHLITDGFGFSVWVQYLASKYRSLVAGEAIQFCYPSYIDEVIKAGDFYNSPAYELEGEYWKERIKQKPEKLLSKKNFYNSNVGKKSSTFIINAADTQSKLFADLQLKTKVSLQQLTIAALIIYFGKTSLQNDFIFGIPLHKRGSKRLRSIVGMFSGIQPFKGYYDDNLILVNFLKDISQAQRKDYRYQNYLIGDLSKQFHSPNYAEGYLVDIVINYEPLNFETDFTSEIKSTVLRLANEYEVTPLQLVWRDYGTTRPLQLHIHYRNEYFTDEEIKLLGDRILFILEQFPAQLTQRIGNIEAIPHFEIDLLKKFNDTSVAYPSDKTIVALFEEQALHTPQSIAVVYEDSQLTYGKLNERSNQLAHYLRSKGVVQETLVPICIERGIEMIVSILGILKAGGAYVPIDPEYPAERIVYMLEDTAATIVITSNQSKEKLPALQAVEIVSIDEDAVSIARESSINLYSIITPASLAYVIYTSGSTGRPKGVMIAHRSIINLLTGIGEEVDFTVSSSFLSVTTYSFDICYLEFYLPLISGGKLIVVARETAIDGFKLARAIAYYAPTHVQGTPVTWQLLLDAGWQNEEGIKILTGGEAIKENLKDALTRLGEVFNLYGPTETTIWSACKKLQQGQQVLIGHPLCNTRIHILNKECQLLPAGIAGEICIGGDGLARGYLNRAELTAEKFIKDPFSSLATARLYRTGDLGRWLPDGNLEYLGRIDDQVKIRGYRIEPAEIEGVLIQSGLVRQAVVVAKEDTSGIKSLIAYVVVDGELDKEVLHGYLQGKLPVYMVPSIWVSLEYLPLTPNGKIDKKALPDPGATAFLSRQYVGPRNETETKLAAIWQGVLGVESVGIYDNFFELGGHSLIAMRVIAAMGKELGVQPAIKDLFVHPTVAQLSAHVQTLDKRSILPAIICVQPRPKNIPLSFSQERMWFIDKLEGSVAYHIPGVLRLKGQLDTGALEYALRAVIKRHEALRTVFYEEQGEVYQQIKEAAEWQLPVVRGSVFKEEEHLQQRLRAFINDPFDLQKDYLLRAEVIEVTEREFILVVVMHHIASDGWSLPVILKEMVAFYTAFEEQGEAHLPALPVQYADYSIWQRTGLQGEVLDKKLQYWKKKLQGLSPAGLQTDFPRPAVQSTAGAVVHAVISKDLLAAVTKLSEQQGCTLFMTLLAVFKVLLYRYTSDGDISVGTPIANRVQQEVEGLVGFFVNTIVLRTQASAHATFSAFLQQVKATALEGYEQQEVPFEKVVEAVVKQRDLSRSPLFQSMFVLEELVGSEVVNAGRVEMLREGFIADTSKFDITFSAIQQQDGLELQVQYNKALFRESTIKNFVIHYSNLLSAVVKIPGEKIGFLPMLAEAEKHQLLLSFNDTSVAYPSDKTIVALFEEQALHMPQSIAVVYEDSQLTYGQLNERSNQLAHYLRSRGVGQETLVPICIERGIEMIVCILGILKAGGAYVPIDPEYPAERIVYMLEDTAATIVITSNQSKEKLPALKAVEIVSIDEDAGVIAHQSADNIRSIITPASLAYVIYTSGSTGRPKGVMIAHKNVSSFIHWCHSEFSTSDFEVVYASTSVCFDLSVFEIFFPLTIGKKIRIIENGLQISQYLPKDIKVLLNTVPVVVDTLLKEGVDMSNISIINMAGEPIPLQVKDALNLERIEVRNLYGPTEDTTYSTCYRLRREQGILIGKPISNTSIYILDSAGELVPAGVVGEICIGGSGVARGYLSQPELTAEKFMKNEFSEGQEERLYKTGDLGRWLPDGNIAYVGRIDDQVKIRGYRIEPGEIESVLLKSGLVKQAVIVAKELADGNKQLIAFVVVNGFDKLRTIRFLTTKLPRFIVPEIWVEIDQIPLTANGKVDKKLLANSFKAQMLSKQYIAPATEMEIILTTMWQKMLKLEQIGIYDEFFELGGSSIIAVRLVSALRKELNIEMAIKDVFEYTTINSLGKYVEIKLNQYEEADDEKESELLII